MRESRELDGGERVYLVKHHDGWGIESYDWAWLDSWPLGFGQGSADIATLEWGELRFHSPDRAYAFVSEQIRGGKAPGAKARPTP